VHYKSTAKLCECVRNKTGKTLFVIDNFYSGKLELPCSLTGMKTLHFENCKL